MFKEESMISFNELTEFKDFCEKLYNHTDWRINYGKLNDRGEGLADKPYVKQLRLLFSEKKLFRRNVSVAEIVSWLDSYKVLLRLITTLKNYVSVKELKNLKLHIEYRIRMSKNRRIDFIFEYRNRILICEFRLSDHFPNLSNMWQKKEIELIIYKELLKNYLPKTMIVFTYAFIAMPEYRGLQSVEKNITYNRNNIDHLARYICYYLIDIKNIKD